MAELQIGNHICIQRPLKVKGIEFDKDGKKEIYVNAKGERCTKVQLSKSEYKWLNDITKQEETGETFKAINGKPVKEFGKTKVIVKYDVCDTSDTEWMVENEATYQLISPTLKNEIKESKKAVSFKYVNSGFKAYKAFVTYNEQFDTLIMRCYRGDLRKIDLKETSVIGQKESEVVESLDISSLDI